MDSNIIVVTATMYTINLHHQFSPPNIYDQASYAPTIGMSRAHCLLDVQYF